MDIEITKFYVPKVKMNYKLAETVLEGEHIRIEGYTYDRVSRRPKGRSIKQTLLNSTETERWIIYN